MRITRIYTAQSLNSGSVVALEPGPSGHLARVLRVKVGDPLILFNGRGGEFAATVTSIGKKQLQAEIGLQKITDSESALEIHLGIAVSRGERMDWAVQKATELGVRAIIPLITEHGGIKLNGERAQKKQRHWQQIAVSACEQCGRTQPPTIQPLQNIGAWVNSTEQTKKFVLHHRASPGFDSGERPDSIALLVGSEGGLSSAEICAAEQSGFLSLRLGPRVLRTETAPLAAIAIVQSIWGDMHPAQTSNC